MSMIRKERFRNRVGVWDFYKGILMIYIVIAHTLNSWEVYEGAVSFEAVFYKTSGLAMVSFFY